MATTSAPAATSSPSSSINVSDNGLTYLSDPNTSGLPPSSEATGGCSRAFHRRSLRFWRYFTRVSLRLPAAGGLTAIVGLLVMGIVGTFALHQMMSPEIEALTQQREILKNDVLVLRLQVENISRIAEGRLETIHLLETELERVQVQAAKSVATHAPGVKNNDIPAGAHNELKGDELSVVLPTIFYTLLMGSVVLASVLYRVFLIIRGEMMTRKVVRKQYRGTHVSSGLMMPSVSESLGGGRNGRETPPLSPTGLSTINDSVSSGSRGACDDANSSQSPKATGECSPQCYKRAPGSSPTIV